MALMSTLLILFNSVFDGHIHGFLVLAISGGALKELLELDFGHETGELCHFEFLSVLLWVEAPLGRLPQFPARYAQEVYFLQLGC